MKRVVSLPGLVLILLVFALFCFRSSSGAADAPIKLTLAHFWPSTHFVHMEQVAGWVQEIEKATNGKVSIQVFPAGTLLKMGDIYEGVATGVADIGVDVFSMYFGRFPLLEALELPGVAYNNAVHGSVVAAEVYNKVDAIRPKDTAAMYVWNLGPGSILSALPIRTLKDLEGKRIHATGRTVDAIRRLGAVPVEMARPEVYMAVKKGLLVGSTGPVEILQGFKEAEVEKFVIPLYGIYSKVGFMVMNQKKWNSLPKDVQSAFITVNEKWPEKAGRIWDGTMSTALKWAQETQKVAVLDLSPEESVRWMNRIAPIEEQFIKETEARGIPARETLKLVKQTAEKYSKQYPVKYQSGATK
jgi:TRAP-type C4-dicarboxylate transport system substrate-binding protein